MTSSGGIASALAQRLVAAAALVARQGERVGLVPVRGEHGREHGIRSLAAASRLGRAAAARPGRAVQPCSLAIRRPDQGGRARRRAVAGLAVGEAGQDPGRLPPGAQPPAPAGRRDVRARPQVVDQLAGRTPGSCCRRTPS